MSEREVRQRVADHRERLRRQGLRPVQIWVSDVRAPGFAAEAHRQSALAAASSHEPDDRAFVDAISSFGDDEDEECDEGSSGPPRMASITPANRARCSLSNTIGSMRSPRLRSAR